MHRGGVHTVPAREGTGWWNERNGKIVSRHREQDAAVEAGREFARQVREEHTIHRSDGVVTEPNAYDSDPAAPSDGD